MIFSHKSVELEYYRREGISPVHQNISNLKKHFQIRASLYRLLGFVPSFFKGKDILEIGPGSGHNSIYIASLLPKTYDLVEPNPTALKDISKIFGNLSTKHTNPKIIPKCIEDLKRNKLYDITISEGWLGGTDNYEKKIFAKISSFVKKGGVMIITFYSPIGGLATFLRRLLGYRLISHLKTMKEKTNVLKKAFSSHLKTMKSMSRSYEHWIQDSILNPHIYVGISTPRIFTKILKNDFKIYQSVPRFAQDWRWYKSLHGKKREFNENFLIDYDKISHCMIDFRMNGIGRSAKKNKELEKFCFEFALKAKNNESLGHLKYMKNVRPVLNKIIRNIEFDLPEFSRKALYEASALLKKEKLNVDEISEMSNFSSFFGREQCFLSMINE